MAVTYETAEEAYATRQKLWEERQLQEHDAEPAAASAADAVPAIDRFMFDLQGFFVVRVRKAPPMLPACMPRHSVRCAGRL